MFISGVSLRIGITISDTLRVYQCMKKQLVFMALVLTTLTIIPVYAKPDLALNIDPEPAYGQMWAFETYFLNITVMGLNISEYSGYDLSGRFIADGIVKWRGTGQYQHGAGVTGYSYILDDEVLTLNTSIEEPSFKHNLTLSQDAFLYGMKPFENVEILLNFDVFFEVNNDTGVEIGPQLGSVSSSYIMIDDDKTDYLEDKLLEMDVEVHAATGAPGLPNFNRTKYESMITAMNSSIHSGDYLRAQDQWERWDDKDRLRMLNAFSSQVESRVIELQDLEIELQSLETELDEHETELELAQIEYNLLEDKYFAVITNNQRTISELESTKQGLTTSITGIFLSAIIFYFLGRRSKYKDED